MSDDVARRKAILEIITARASRGYDKTDEIRQWERIVRMADSVEIPLLRQRKLLVKALERRGDLEAVGKYQAHA